MSNSFHNTKLRGTERTRSRSQFQVSYNTKLEIEPTVSSGLFYPHNTQDTKKVSSG